MEYFLEYRFADRLERYKVQCAGIKLEKFMLTTFDYRANDSNLATTAQYCRKWAYIHYFVNRTCWLKLRPFRV